MPKKIVQDIISQPNGVKSSLIQETHGEKPHFLLRKKGDLGTEKPDLKVLLAEEPPRRRRNTIIAISIAIFVIALFFLFSALFSGATVIVTPTQKTAPLDITVTAENGALLPRLGFQLVTMRDSASKEIPATGTKNIERKASGQIMVYNNYDTREFRLVKDTRFESPDGKIFKIPNAIVIPGRRTVNGKRVPGSVEVTVIADTPGSEYNIPLSDFTVPGLKSDPELFRTIFARSKTPMTGGYAGEVKIVSPEELERAQAELNLTLKNDLLENTAEQVPADSVLFTGATKIDYSLAPESEVADPGGNNKTLEVKENAVLYGIIFDRRDLARFLAEKLISGYEGESITVSNLEELEFILEDEINLNDTTREITFTLSGAPHFIWGYDAEGLKNSLSGSKKKEIESITRAGFPTIEKIAVRLRPPWRFTMPDNSEKIKVRDAEPR